MSEGFRHAVHRHCRLKSRAVEEWQAGIAKRKAEKEAKQATCHHSWAHRNDGKTSVCRLCDFIRNNEP